MTFQISLSLPTKKEIRKEYDLVIVGAGPAGCSAALYARRYTLSTLIIAKKFGGLIADAEIVDNYPGLPEISGSDLANKFLEHAKKYGAETYMQEVLEIQKQDNIFVIKLADGKEVRAKSIILALGEKHRKLNVPGEKEFEGRGVSYCAVCDAPLFKNEVVAIVGGGNVAFSDVQVLAKHAKKVYLIHRRNWFRADPIEIEKVKKTPNIEFKTPYIIKEIRGKEKVESLLLQKVKEENGKIVELNEFEELKVSGLFVAIGLIPNTELAEKLGIELDQKGYIVVDDCMKTNIEGVFAAGDCTNKGAKFRQVVLAAAQGAIAATSAFKYLKEKFSI